MSPWFRKVQPESDSAAKFDSGAATDKLRGLIASKSKFVSAQEIETDTKLFSSGILDSLAYIELVLFVEREFQVSLSKTAGLSSVSLDSIGQIIELVQEHRREEPSARAR